MPFDDEAHCEGSVSVSGRDFIGHHELQTCIDGIGSERGVWFGRSGRLVDSWEETYLEPD